MSGTAQECHGRPFPGSDQHDGGSSAEQPGISTKNVKALKVIHKFAFIYQQFQSSHSLLLNVNDKKFRVAVDSYGLTVMIELLQNVFYLP